MSSINLVSTNVVGLEKELKRLKIFRIIAVLFLIIVSAMAVLVFVLNITLPTESVKKEQQSTIVGISLFDKKLAQYVLLDDRVKNISSLISKRKNYVPNIYKIFGKISDDTSVDMLSIQTGQLALTVSSGSLPSINKFIDDLVAFGVSGKIIKNVIIQGLTLNVDSGKYSLSIKADIL